MKYSYKELKQIIKNIAIIAKHRYQGDYQERQFIRHVYLAYQWIKTKDLTKAENPQLTRNPIHVNLLLMILKEWDYKLELSHQDLINLLESQGFKTKEVYKDDYQKYSIGLDESFMLPKYSIMISPIVSEEHLKNWRFWGFLGSLYKIYIQAQISYSNMATFISFINKKGSTLSLRFENEFNMSKCLVQYNFTIINKIQSTGILDLSYPPLGNWTEPSGFNMIEHMVNELVRDKK